MVVAALGKPEAGQKIPVMPNPDLAAAAVFPLETERADTMGADRVIGPAFWSPILRLVDLAVTDMGLAEAAEEARGKLPPQEAK